MRDLQRKGLWVGLFCSAFLHAFVLFTLPQSAKHLKSGSQTPLYVSLQDSPPPPKTALDPSAQRPISTLSSAEEIVLSKPSLLHSESSATQNRRILTQSDSESMTGVQTVPVPNPIVTSSLQRQDPHLKPHNQSSSIEIPLPSAVPSSVSSPKQHPSEQTLQQALIQALRPYIHYPKLAQRRNWEGTVVLSLQIDSRGYFSRIEVSQSSGHTLLDHSAKRSLQRLKSLPNATIWLGQSPHQEMHLPIRYQLIEG